MKKILSALLSAAVMLLALSESALFALEKGATYIWNGKREFEDGVNFSVRSLIHISGDVVVPENTVLYVRKGGTLVIDEGGSLTVKGKTVINNGGVLRSFGSVTVEKTGEISNYGWLINREGGSLSVKGSCNIFTVGKCNNYGKMNVEKGANLYITGHLYSREKSALSLSGKLRLMEKGFLRCYGTMTVPYGGNAQIKGRLDVTKEGKLNLSGGKLNVSEKGSLTGGGAMQLSNFLPFTSEGKVTLKVIPPKVRKVNGAYYVGEVLICNKNYNLPESYGDGIYSEAEKALKKMRQESGYYFNVISGYRSYQSQLETFTYWENLYGTREAERISARAGASEHQTGLAFDVTSLYVSYGDTEEGKWLAENCHKYGFIIRFPDGCENHTG